MEKRGSVFAYHGMAENIDISMGPLVTILLLLVLDWRVVVALLTIPAVLAVAYALRVDIDERAAVAVDGNGTDGSRAGSDVPSFRTSSRVLVRSSRVSSWSCSR